MSTQSASPTLPRLARWLVVGAVCVSLGLPWAVLQGVAWTGMLISYSRDGSLMEAVTKTFDGDHPCPLCKAVESGQKQDQEQKRTQGPEKKFEAVLVAFAHIVPPHGTAVEYSARSECGERRAVAPPWIPPRREAA